MGLLDIGQSQWTRWSCEMHLLVSKPRELISARRLVNAELDVIEAAASRFRSDSEITRLLAADGAPTPVSPVLADLIEAALLAARFTDGDVDPTIGPAMVAMGYHRDIEELAPETPMVTSIVAPANWTMIGFDGHSVTVPRGVILDLGATAKAVAADRCARRVYDQTGSGVLVNLGGDISTAGPCPEGDWQVLVQDTTDDPPCFVALGSDAGLATSSTQRRQWRHRGVLVHHILNPRTGQPADRVWRSVTVAARTCLAANTMSTAAVVRASRAADWLAALDVPARLVGRDNVVRTLGGWPAR